MKTKVTIWADRKICGIRQTVGPLGEDRTIFGPGMYRGSLYDYYRGLGYQIRETTRHEVVRDRVIHGAELTS